MIRDDDGNWLHIEYIENDGDGLDVVVKHIIRNGSYSQDQLHQLPEMANNPQVYFKSTQELLEKALSKYNINELTLPDEYINVRFITPKVGDITHVNYNYVPVYKKANESSIIIGHINISHLFKVIKTSQGWLKIERPGDGDSTYGYKELTGYIKGELAEPVEKIIGINTHSYPTVEKDNRSVMSGSVNAL
ncbi:MAG: hypothetical protein LIO77_03670 [Rikenellaceae bacterium]|nr:hypothetical protein [Rikenellaceae bacterium]